MHTWLKHLVAFGAMLTSVGASANDIHMVAPNIPPHFNHMGNGRIGDVIRATLARCGHQVRFTMVPFGRHWKEYKDSTAFDGLATAEAGQSFPGFSTRPFMHLQDGATVMAARGLQEVSTVSDLKGRHVVAFPNASEILGIERDVPAFASYAERSNRYDQIRPLFADRVDAILADGLITAHFIGVLADEARAGREPEIDPSRRPVFRRIFQAGPQRLYFRDQTVAADFDRCFRQLLSEGEVDRLVQPYLDRYRAIVGDQYPSY
jgi:ABC-type amino acid transport substrate-binding protein